MSTKSRDSFRLSSKSVYDEFFPEDIAEQGLLNGTLFKGTLRVTAQKRNIAYVTAEKAKIDVCIDNESLRNRSVNDDTVIIQLLPESEWTTPLKESSLSTIIEGINPQPPKSPNETNQKLWKPRGDLSLKKPSAVTEISDPLKTIHPIDESAQRTTLQPRGKVVFVYPRSKPVLLVGSLDGSNNNIQLGCKLPKSAPYVFFRPSDNKYPSFIINRLDIPEAYINDPFNVQKQIFLAELSPVWPTDSKMPFGCNVRSIGEVGSIQAETEALLLEHGLHHNYFENEVVAPLKKLLGSSLLIDTSSREVNWNIPADEIAKRRDLRHYRIFTIDPSNAKDLDDALHITPLGKDIYEIGVHIADVSFFIPENTPLDLEARKRATSVYLVQKVIPMLPPILCEQLCSLNPNVDRLAFSVIWKMHGDGTLTDDEPWFGRTVIRCCAKLDYTTAQRMIDDVIPSEGTQNNIHEYLAKISEDIWETSRRPSMTSSFSYSHALWDIAKDVCVFNTIATQRRAVRLQNGAIALHQPKLTFLLDAHGNPAEVQTYNIRQSNKLVEEYMLLANYLVAQQLVQRASRAAFLRRHPAPSSSGLEELEKLAAHVGISIDTSSAESLQKGLSELTNSTDELVIQAVTCLMMRPMKPAEYFVVNDVRNPDYWNHYALAIPYYTHFTSPIRRYADIEVHRLLTLTLQPQPLVSPSKRSSGSSGTKEEQELVNEDRISVLSMNAANCNDMKLAAKNAQTRSSEVFFAIYLMNNPVDTEAIVLGIGPKTFTIYTPQFGLQSKLFVDEMSGVSHSFNDETKELTLTRRTTSSSSNGNGSSTGSDKGKNKRGRGGAASASGGGSSPKPSEHIQSTTLKFKSMTITLMSTIIVRISARTVPPPVALQFSLVGPSGNTVSQNDSMGESPVKPPHASPTPQKGLGEESVLLAECFASEISLIDEGEQALPPGGGDVEALNADNSSSSNGFSETAAETFTIDDNFVEEVVVLPPAATATEVATTSPVKPPPQPRSSAKVATQGTRPAASPTSSPLSPTAASSSSSPLPSKRSTSSSSSDTPAAANDNLGAVLVVEEEERVDTITANTKETNISNDTLDVVPTKRSGSVKLRVVIDDHDTKLPKAKTTVIDELTASMTVLTDTLKAITVEDTPSPVVAAEKSSPISFKEPMKDTLDHVSPAAGGGSPRSSSRAQSKASTTATTTAAAKPSLTTDNKKGTAAAKLLKRAPSAPAPIFSPMKPLHSNSFSDDVIHKKHHLSPNHHPTGNTSPSSRLTRSTSLGHKSPVPTPDLVESVAVAVAVAGHPMDGSEAQGVAASITTATANDKTEGSAKVEPKSIKSAKSPRGASTKGSSELFSNSPKHVTEKGKEKEGKTSPLPPPHKANPSEPATPLTPPATTPPAAVTSSSSSDKQQVNADSTLTAKQTAATDTSANPSAPSTKAGVSIDTDKATTITTTATGLKATSKPSLASATAAVSKPATSTVTAAKNSAARRQTLGGGGGGGGGGGKAAGHPPTSTAAVNPLAEDDVIPADVAAAAAKAKPVSAPAGGGGRKPLPTSGHDTDSTKLKSNAIDQPPAKTTVPKSSTSYAASANSRKSILPTDTKSDNGEREKLERKPAPPLKSRTKSAAALLTTSTTTASSSVNGRKSLASTQKVASEKLTVTEVSKEKADVGKQTLPPTPAAASTAKSMPKSNPTGTVEAKTNQPTATESAKVTAAAATAAPPDAAGKSKHKPSSVTATKHTPKIVGKSMQSAKAAAPPPPSTAAVESLKPPIIAAVEPSVGFDAAKSPTSEPVESAAATSSPLPLSSSATAAPVSVPVHGATGSIEMKGNNKKVSERKPLPGSSLPPKKPQGGEGAATAATTTAPSTAPAIATASATGAAKTVPVKLSNARKSLMPSDSKPDGAGELKAVRKSLAPKVPPAAKGSIPSGTLTAAPVARRSSSTGRLGNLAELPPPPPSTTTTTAKTSTIKSTRTPAAAPVARRSLSTGRLGNLAELPPPPPPSTTTTTAKTSTIKSTRTPAATPVAAPKAKSESNNETDPSTNIKQKPRNSMSSNNNNNNNKPQSKPSAVKASKDKK